MAGEENGSSTVLTRPEPSALLTLLVVSCSKGIVVLSLGLVDIVVLQPCQIAVDDFSKDANDIPFLNEIRCLAITRGAVFLQCIFCICVAALTPCVLGKASRSL